MSTAVLPRPADIGANEDDHDHIYCCDPDLSLCGLDIAGHEDLGEFDSPNECPPCSVAWDLGGPCAAAGCTGR